MVAGRNFKCCWWMTMPLFAKLAMLSGILRFMRSKPRTMDWKDLRK